LSLNSLVKSRIDISAAVQHLPPDECTSPGAPWECHPITCDDAHVFTGYSPLNQDLQNPVGIVQRDQVYPVHGMQNEGYAARIKYQGDEYYIQRACVDLPPPQCTSPGAPWECRSVTCRDASVFTGYSPTNQDLQNPIGTVYQGEVYPTHEMQDERYAARIKWRGSEFYILRSCVDFPPLPPPNPCGGVINGWLCRSIDCHDATVFSGYSPSQQDLQNPIGTVHAGEWYQTNIVDQKASRIKWNGRDAYVLRYCLEGPCCPNPPPPTPPPPNPCGGVINGWLCRMIDCHDATVFSGYSPSQQDLQNPIGTVHAGEWYQTNIVDQKASRIKWNGRDGYVLRYCLEGSCCPNPPPPPPPTQPPPPPPPPQLCYTHCCDGREGETWFSSQGDCWNWAGAFCGNVKINTIHFPKYNVIYNADSCRCCAKCGNRSNAYNMGPFVNCTDRARDWCSRSDRGGLQNAFWGWCPDPPN